MRCCVKCFNNNHLYLIQFIKKNGTRGGICDYCGATKTTVIDPGELKPLFEPLISLYEPLSLGENVMPDEEWINIGEPFATLLENDFSVFSETALDRANELVEAIFTGNLSPFDLAEAPYRFSVGDWWCDRDRNFFSRDAGTDSWDNFSYPLRYERRFIPDENDVEIYDPRYWLGEMVRQIETLLPAGTRFYRGRTELHSLDQMGVPPHELTSAGRANPKGISFLYLAADPATVVAELRPWKGQTISIAEFELVERVKVIDLFQELPQVSPFGLSQIPTYIN